MADIYFNSLLLPLFFVPVLFLLKLIGRRSAACLWVAFLAAAITDSFTDNALLSVSSFLFCVFAYFLYKRGIFLKNEKESKIAIVIGKNSKNAETALFDGYQMFTLATLEDGDIGCEDVVIIKNCKKCKKEFDIRRGLW